MRCSAFIATSADGYIATPDGGVEWLASAGCADVDKSEPDDMGFKAYIASIDCLIMGRKTLQKLASFNLTDEQWPYGDRRIVALSRSQKSLPANLSGKAEFYHGSIPDLLAKLQSEGHQQAYIDGGETITAFIEQRLLDEITVTVAPLLLGEGIPLFGRLSQSVPLHQTRTRHFPNGFVQLHYRLRDD